MSVSDDLHAELPDGELTVHRVKLGTGIPQAQVRARMGVLRRQDRLEYLRDEPCDPSLGDYLVGVYRRRDDDRR
jgi:hypothetical protein